MKTLQFNTEVFDENSKEYSQKSLYYYSYYNIPNICSLELVFLLVTKRPIIGDKY